MTEKLKLIRVALQNNRMDVAAHALVLSIIKVKTDQVQEKRNGQNPGRAARQPER